MITNDSISAVYKLFCILMHRIVINLLNSESRVSLEVVPQSADKLTYDDVIAILLDNMQ